MRAIKVTINFLKSYINGCQRDNQAMFKLYGFILAVYGVVIFPSRGRVIDDDDFVLAVYGTRLNLRGSLFQISIGLN